MLCIFDREGEVRVDEDEIEQGHREKRGQQRRPTAQKPGYHEHHEQEQHHDVGGVDPGR